MRSFWLIARHEYHHTVARRGFVIMTAAIPLGLIALIGLGILVEGIGKDSRPVGYVDHSNTLNDGLHTMMTGADARIQILAFPDEATGRNALEAEEIQALFVLPAEYPQTLHTELYYLEEPPTGEVWRHFDDYVRLNLLSGMPEEIQQRLLEGPDIAVRDIVSNREFSRSSAVNIVLPFVATFLLFFATMAGSGYMLGIVAGEKENRTIEVMVTTVTPGQLIGGKTLGLLAAALTQLTIYFLAVVVGLVVAAPHVPELQQIAVPWGYLGVVALFFLPTYALVSAMMVAIAGAVGEVQQGQQLAGLLYFFFMLPMLLVPILFKNPAHPLMVFFTLFPTTSFLTISLRWGLGTVPLWQVGVSWVFLVATTGFVVWAAARIFRAGMLHYGQPLSVKAALASLRRA
ncbi:MAG TPA: ABC transporter permease [Anaerolineae bacterium]|nr:ABC transporter permease [Anaerolineae bacterium]